MTAESFKNVDNVKAQMRKGILEYCILSILSRGDSYAPQIIAELKDADMIVVEGTLYPLLARQKNQGLLSYRWEESPQGPPRKYYMITDRGREVLGELDGVWEEMVAQIRTIRYGTGAAEEGAATKTPTEGSKPDASEATQMPAATEAETSEASPETTKEN